MSKERAVVDEDLPRIIDKVLEELGWEVFDVRDVGLRGKLDSEIIRFAKKSKAVLFTGDWGFADILIYPPEQYHGIVMLNFPNEFSTIVIAEETRKSLKKLQGESLSQKLIIIEPGKIRIRK
ncbi:MAG: DUF5615 family PIN-like protein [bacterium]|nr:DUF5615 family PIN-like protein [bacterium]